MKKHLAIAAVLFLSMPAWAQQTSEVLVLTSSTSIPRVAKSKAVEIYNNGPNTIFCALGTAAILNKSRPIPAGGSWSIPVPSQIVINCIAATANQVTGAATIVSEARQ